MIRGKYLFILVITIVVFTCDIFSADNASPPGGQVGPSNTNDSFNNMQETPSDPSLNFSPSQHREIKVQLGGSFETYFEIHSMRRTSPFYLLNFYKSSRDDSYLTLFEGDVNLNLDFVYDKVEFHMKSQIQYINPSDLKFNLLEAMNRINFSQKLMTEIGVIRFAWGKGSFTNPVGFINPAKDPLDTSKLYKGVPAFHVQFINTWNDGALKAFGLNAITAFDYASVNNKYGKLENFKFAGKIYLLLLDTDLDFIAYGGKKEPVRFGFDFSRNIGPSIEMHGEFVYYHNFNWNYVNELGVVTPVKVNRITSLIGIRVVFPYDINLTIEYLYNGLGYTNAEYINVHHFGYAAYYGLITNTNPALASSIDILKTSTGNVFFKQHYVYININEIDTFGIKYLKISLSFIINLQDRSMIFFPTINYAPYPNLEMQLYFRWYIGSAISEFQDVHVQYVIGFMTKISF